jgi:putative toxin-antitoxin system antitoxin component (TIGR02293 family)
MKKSTILNIDKLGYGGDKSGIAFMLFVPDSSAFSKEVNSEPLDVIGHLRKGLPKEAVTKVLETTCVSREQLSNILHISTRQLSRYEPEQRLSSEQSNFLYELSLLYVSGEDIFGDRPTFEHWLQRSQMALGNQVPLDMLDTTEGFRMVNDLLSQVEYGFFS